MKDLITTIGSMLILMMFLTQFAASQTTYTRIMGAEHEIKEFRLLSGEQGSIRNENILQLKQNLSQVLECNASEISVNITDGDYVVTMPVYGVIGPWKLLGISQKENVKEHVSKGVIVFETQEQEQEEAI
ncbi:MAG: hypothetical protein MST07_08775 [Firmicutes bacterium]|nr:hypothetical protein [Bacillota bacterium]